MRILVTGGGGYLGSGLIPLLMQAGHQVRLLDNASEAALSRLYPPPHSGLEIVNGDVRNPSVVRMAMNDQEAVVHLAAIVGYPACDANQDRAISTNVGGTQNVVRFLEGRPLVFASTCSVYGKVADLCDENTPARPLTLYGRTKLEAESIVRNAGAVILRFATLFGSAPNLRLDLLVNDFVWQSVCHKRLSVYQPQFRRTFLHVHDAARSVIMALDLYDRMRSATYNVADERTNITKRQLAEQIQVHVPFDLTLSDEGRDSDHRDYEVSSARIRAIGFSPEMSLDQGIQELIEVIRGMKDKPTIVQSLVNN